MELLIKSRNLDIAEEAEAYARSKIGKLERHLPNMEEVRVELSREKIKEADRRYVAQITVNSHGTLLRAQEKAPNINAAIDEVVDVLDRQIERFKGRLYRSHRKTASAIKGLAIEHEETMSVTKVKRFPIRSMSPHQAAEQMELLGHDFFLFVNDESDQFNVVYRRSEGSYGVIEPEIA
jgi:putative sigma-54 modulation protein